VRDRHVVVMTGLLRFVCGRKRREKIVQRKGGPTARLRQIAPSTTLRTGGSLCIVQCERSPGDARMRGGVGADWLSTLLRRPARPLRDPWWWISLRRLGGGQMVKDGNISKAPLLKIEDTCATPAGAWYSRSR
jgi:hypothetical protein